MSGRVEFSITRAGACDAIGGWFSAVLGPGIELTNAPGAPHRIDRRNVLFPLRETVNVEAGDHVVLSMFIRPEELLVRWRVSVSRGNRVVHETDASTLGGMLISPDDVRRTRLSAIPTLTESGSVGIAESRVRLTSSGEISMPPSVEASVSCTTRLPRETLTRHRTSSSSGRMNMDRTM